ncbi:MAG: 23S rRNA (guanosine(2251)-2'-O)-methyltransferase RlmB [Bacteroidetes bacterium HGW-Bacteroidetes-1]|jgi:23S rRNA (guanosine2251-2'-O)-methyltransferase|nr:MAG: 23S rRNA (guanosine(2251)-2'-O)-methyltransferase RlmB [Bacteroidetes bacterium HGW-Bacteroidetes-1]
MIADIERNDILFGTRPIIEALKSGREIEKVLVQSGSRSPQIGELLGLARLHEVPIQTVPQEKLNRLTRKNHQGVVAFLSPVLYQKIESLIPILFDAGKLPFIIIMDKITDVRNFGAIARTAEAAGAHAILVPTRGSAMINADAVKTSAGALNRINLCREDNLKVTIDFLKASGLRIAAITEKADRELWDSDLTGPVALIMGSEENGISEAYLKMADTHLKLPMLGTIESLNVSVAAGIACYEIVRQRR